MNDPYRFARHMQPSDATEFGLRFNAQRKSAFLGAMLCLFLGGFGVHHFYLARSPIRVCIGIGYLLFCWTMIPAVLGLMEAAFVPSQVAEMNDDIARGIAEDILLARRRRSVGEIQVTGGW